MNIEPVNYQIKFLFLLKMDIAGFSNGLETTMCMCLYRTLRGNLHKGKYFALLTVKSNHYT